MAFEVNYSLDETPASGSRSCSSTTRDCERVLRCFHKLLQQLRNFRLQAIGMNVPAPSPARNHDPAVDVFRTPKATGRSPAGHPNHIDFWPTPDALQNVRWCFVPPFHGGHPSLWVPRRLWGTDETLPPLPFWAFTFGTYVQRRVRLPQNTPPFGAGTEVNRLES